jgi:imidazole glycerol-phosphate synthase subunit HisH
MITHAVIVPAGGANYGSLREACRRVGVDATISDEPKRIFAATHVILPGVGAAGHAMRNLRERGLDRVLKLIAQPLLGICLGMQLLFDASEESERAEPSETIACLGLLSGVARRLPAAPSWPHMGWNTLGRRVEHPLLADIDDDDWFYFVHGYAVPIGADTLAATSHGETFTSVVARGNICGAQFHPEKSAAAGRRLLTNFFAMT